MTWPSWEGASTKQPASARLATSHPRCRCGRSGSPSLSPSTYCLRRSPSTRSLRRRFIESACSSGLRRRSTRPALMAFSGACRSSVTWRGSTSSSSTDPPTDWTSGFPELAADLVRAKVDLIVTRGTQAILATKNATNTIPIIIITGAGDPVAQGMVASLARPGGNITGLNPMVTELYPKRVELLPRAGSESRSDRGPVQHE